ncbi:UNKNOWN [Stylonychia lemnae]|uniref:Cathepsin l n=1 Tax=Stylonychia lemnae TaxID=5949 RepID=A0A077ZV34_STYLE|nr:UNKNOWN [Stylonychia lemnae]|eukprot:CDW73464.1 UNKNOWN [Stylonychia lemnae]
MKKGFAITLAVVGVVAVAAVIALNETPAQTQLNFRTVNDDNVDFNHYMSRFSKNYKTPEEYNQRLALYKKTMATINSHNANNGGSFFLRPNKFTDMTKEEYKKLLGFKPSNKIYKRAVSQKDPSTIPDAIDWRDKGVVNEVKDQAQCGSCWAFSTVGALESRTAIKTGKLQSLSEQQLVDCDTQDGNQGCNGGDMGTAMTYIASNPLETEDDYPYAGYDESCQADQSKEIVSDQGPVAVTPSSSDALKAAVAEGPVSVAIEADTDVFQSYGGGILNDDSCGTNLDHGVVVVGYGSENGQEYYIVRNSWSSTWGENGYVRIAIVDGDGICGIQMQPVYPQV